MSAKVIDIREDRTRMEVRLEENLGKVVQDFFHSHICGSGDVWLVEHLRHTGQ